MKPTYQYAAAIFGVYDGDSVTADVDLGMRVTIRVKLRLLGIDAPEMGTPEGTAARDYLRSLVLYRPVVIRTHKDPGDKYGRWLADIEVDGQSVAVAMLTAGHAEPYPVRSAGRCGLSHPHTPTTHCSGMEVTDA